LLSRRQRELSINAEFLSVILNGVCCFGFARSWLH
jgi:hypothetical protein